MARVAQWAVAAQAAGDRRCHIWYTHTMKLHAVIQVSQDGHNWTILAFEPPIPLTLLAGWAFVRPALIYLAEPGDEAIDVTPTDRR
jgi:hypothetical protein